MKHAVSNMTKWESIAFLFILKKSNFELLLKLQYHIVIKKCTLLAFSEANEFFWFKMHLQNAITFITLDFTVANTLSENILVSLVIMKKWPKLKQWKKLLWPLTKKRKKENTASNKNPKPTHWRFWRHPLKTFVTQDLTGAFENSTKHLKH